MSERRDSGQRGCEKAEFYLGGCFELFLAVLSKMSRNRLKTKEEMTHRLVIDSPPGFLLAGITDRMPHRRTVKTAEMTHLVVYTVPYMDSTCTGSVQGAGGCTYNRVLGGYIALLCGMPGYPEGYSGQGSLLGAGSRAG